MAGLAAELRALGAAVDEEAGRREGGRSRDKVDGGVAALATLARAVVAASDRAAAAGRGGRGDV